MRDKQGFYRGACGIGQCDCTEFSYDGETNKCEDCGHLATKHPISSPPADSEATSCSSPADTSALSAHTRVSSVPEQAANTDLQSQSEFKNNFKGRKGHALEQLDTATVLLVHVCAIAREAIWRASFFDS